VRGSDDGLGYSVADGGKGVEMILLYILLGIIVITTPVLLWMNAVAVSRYEERRRMMYPVKWSQLRTIGDVLKFLDAVDQKYMVDFD
jgi:hypothetical protein